MGKNDGNVCQRVKPTEKKLICVMLVFVLMVLTTFSFNKQKSKLTLKICNIGIISTLGIYGTWCLIMFLLCCYGP